MWHTKPACRARRYSARSTIEARSATKRRRTSERSLPARATGPAASLAASLRRTPSPLAWSSPISRNPSLLTLRGAEDIARKSGGSLLLFLSTEDPEHGPEVLTTLEETRFDRILMCSPRMEAEPDATLVAHNWAVVLLNLQLPASSPRTVLVDDVTATISAVRHLVPAGRRLISFLAGPTKQLLRSHRQPVPRSMLCSATTTWSQSARS